MKVRSFRKNQGFTLIELMIVIVIVGILLAILLGRLGLIMDRAREKTTHKNLKNIKLAIDATCEQSDGGYDYPADGAGFKAKLEERFGVEKIPRAVLRIGVNTHPSNDCFVANAVTDIPVPGPPGGGWVLIIAGEDRGRVCINSNELDTNGNPYSSYICD
ncbi:MAG: type II secretion system protein [bacterium]